MGMCQSAPNAEVASKSRTIDRELRKQERTAGKEVKLLLLGTGASGKSTIAKQMKILYLKGFSDKELSIYTEIVFFNIIKSMKTLVLQADAFGYQLKKENEATAEELRNMTIQMSDVELTTERGQGIQGLWADDAIKQAMERSAEFQIDDSASYFFDHLDRISEEGYRPSVDDILHVRAKTTGIVETEFVTNGLHFRMVDVGGQRNERKKWIHCFQDVTAIIFVVAISEYDLVLEEDLTTNRMRESLRLFSDIVNNRWFMGTNIILFLNKKDLFEEKIKKVPLTVCFPDYDGQQTYEAGVAFVGQQFLALDQAEDEQHRYIYKHETCAVDTQNTRVVFEAIQDIFLNRQLSQAGFIG